MEYVYPVYSVMIYLQAVNHDRILFLHSRTLVCSLVHKLISCKSHIVSAPLNLVNLVIELLALIIDLVSDDVEF